jgi:hypothetical protein
MVDAEGIGQLIDRNDRRIASSAFQAAYILLAKARNLAELLLRQPFSESYPLKIVCHEPSHIHAGMVQGVCTLSLPTIICITDDGLG